MEVLYPRCCGWDVPKSSMTACALLREQGRIRTERRRFTTMTQELKSLAAWLWQLQGTHVAVKFPSGSRTYPWATPGDAK